MKHAIFFWLTILWVPVCASANPFSELYYYRPIQPGPSKSLECDLAVYGGTPAGVAAAIQAAKMGKKVLFFSFNKQVGGL
ncbi:MAG: FAD-dependent oxidoreductase, partial [Pirellulales bacterium]